MKHKIEIFSSGCKTCQDTIATVKKLAGSEHEVIVHDMHQEAIASRAIQHGVKSVPAVGHKRQARRMLCGPGRRRKRIA